MEESSDSDQGCQFRLGKKFQIREKNSDQGRKSRVGKKIHVSGEHQTRKEKKIWEEQRLRKRNSNRNNL